MEISEGRVFQVEGTAEVEFQHQKFSQTSRGIVWLEQIKTPVIRTASYSEKLDKRQVFDLHLPLLLNLNICGPRTLCF